MKILKLDDTQLYFLDMALGRLINRKELFSTLNGDEIIDFDVDFHQSIKGIYKDVCKLRKEHTSNRMVEILEVLISVCEYQINALNQRNDVHWNCYDVGNWRAMFDSLQEIKQYLKG